MEFCMKNYFFALTLCLPLPAAAQSEASETSTLSEASAATVDAFGEMLGAGASVALGSVVITGSLAYVTLEASVEGTAQVVRHVIEVPIEIAEWINRQSDKTLLSITDDQGTKLLCNGKTVYYAPRLGNQYREKL
jgi:hypothetical protein